MVSITSIGDVDKTLVMGKMKEVHNIKQKALGQFHRYDIIIDSSQLSLFTKMALKNEKGDMR